MSLAEIINTLVRKFGSRVKFLEVDQLGCNIKLGCHEYAISRTQNFMVCEELIEADITDVTNHSKWLTGVLMDMVRDDEGVLQHHGEGL